MGTITKKTYDFLKNLAKNNNKPWFDANRDRYEESHQEMIEFAEALISELGKYDNLVDMTGKKSLFRIYRDVRFSKDKTRYKIHWAGQMKRDSVWLRGGYYYHIKPGQMLIACGFWGPEKNDLKLIRDHIARDAAPLRKLIFAKKFKDVWGIMEGEKLKTAPKGYPKDHSDLDLLKHKQFIVHKNFSDKEAQGDNFIKKCVESYRAIRPFFDYMSEILTHDLNGEALY